MKKALTALFLTVALGVAHGQPPIAGGGPIRFPIS